MKKIISSVLVCIMLLGISAPCAIASEQTAYGDKVVFYSPNIKTNSGEDFVFEVNVRDNPGICTYFIALEYDPALFDTACEYDDERLVTDKSVIAGSVISNEKYDENTAVVMSVNTDNTFADGNIFGFRFTVKEDAPQTKATIKVVLKEVIHWDDNGGTNDIFDLFEGSAPSYDVTVAINSTEEIAEISEAELKCLTEAEFAATYEERLEALKTPKPTPKPIYATPRPENTDTPQQGTESGDGETDDSSTLKKPEAVLNESFTGYMAPAAEDKFEPDRAATRYEIVGALDVIFTVENAEDRDDFVDVTEEYKKAVNELAQVGIISGYEDKTFGGERNITRAEFVKLLTEAFGIEYDNAVNNSLTDISGHWAESRIKAFVNAGYIVGYPDGSFKPDANITRAEAVAVLNRVLNINGSGAAEAKFSDLPEEHWAFGAVMAIFSR